MENAREQLLNAVFFALSDPVRRRILERLERGPLLVSELAEPFQISLQAVSQHTQVLVRAGLIEKERTGRISRCSLVVGPIVDAAVWLNRYAKYWQQQFDVLAASLEEIEAGRTKRNKKPSKRVIKPRPKADRTGSRRTGRS